ncbi:MAG TPA: hypothetical protein VFZ59_02160 [Verrucomicrobiae bacterium]|nr:hypothetical protein [Verrucomicrobiae bacterium]
MSRLTVLPAGWLSALFFLSVSFPAIAGDGKGKGDRFEAQLIWVTNGAVTNKEPKLKPVDPEVQKKLDELPLKWKSYYMVKRQSFSVPKGGTNAVVMSDKCTVELKRLDEPKVEVTLHGKNGNVCSKRTQPFPKAEILIFSGKSAGDTAWLVTLKRID